MELKRYYINKFKVWYYFAFLLPLLLTDNLLNAQACCSGGVPLGGSIGLGSAEYRSFQFLLTYDYNSLQTLVDISDILNDHTRRRTTHSSIAEINYGISDRLTITGIVPFIRQERRIQSFGGTEDITVVNGLGDALFLLKLRLLNTISNPDLEWIVGIGPKFPTGRTNHVNKEGLILVADMQPGSGSLDGILWSYFQKSGIFIPNMSLLAVTTFRYSGANKTYNSTQEFRFGNEFQFSLGLNYNLFAKWPIDIFSFIRYRNQSEDLIDGNTFPSSGGQWAYVIPGMNISFTPEFSFRFSGDVPVYRKLAGTQLTTTYKLTVAVLYNFSTRKRTIVLN